MAFPLSISGHVPVCKDEEARRRLIIEHLRAALSSQSVDSISVVDDTIRFTPQATGSEKASRPDGVSWMFRLIGPSILSVDSRSATIGIIYHLNCRFWFFTTTLFSALAGIAMDLTTAVGTGWAVFSAFGAWTVLFASGYLGTRIDFHHWLTGSLASFGISSAGHSARPGGAGE